MQDPLASSVSEFLGVPRSLPHPLHITSNSCPPGKPCTSLLSGLIQMFSCLLFFSFSPHPSYIFFPSFISISVIFFGSISASVPLIMLIWGICYSRGPSASVSVSLSFTLSSFSISWLVSIFCLWPRFLPSCRKAINPAGPAAGSRQSLGSRSCGEGAAERRGHGKAGALLLHQGRGEAEKSREMPLPEGSHSFPAGSRHLAPLSVVSQGTWVPPLYAPNRGFSSKTTGHRSPTPPEIRLLLHS